MLTSFLLLAAVLGKLVNLLCSLVKKSYNIQFGWCILKASKREGGHTMATIKALENNKWQLSGEGISVTYGFSVDGGINLCEFWVLNENGNVNYCQKESSIVPIVNTDSAIENGRPPFRWKLVSADFGETVYNKKPVYQLDVAMETLLYKLTFHAVLFPGVSVIKQWWECENTSVARTNGFTLKPFSAEFGYKDYKNSYWLSTFAGGHTRPTQGDMTTKMLGGGMKYKIGGMMSYEYCPWITVCCEEAPYDGVMFALDYMGQWEMELDCNGLTTYTVTCIADGGKQLELFPKQKLTLPGMTFAAFNGSHDALMQVLYDWQYRYMFDATSDKYYAATKAIGPADVANLNFSELICCRPAKFDLETAADAQFIGANGTWSDAGWYATQKLCPGALFQNSLEGPDFRESIKYSQKTGLGYTLWFSGSKILDGVMESKVNWWGDFEWRTDAYNMRNQREYLLAKKKVENFTDPSPERAFHSCNGGGSYCHNFEVQRLTSFNYTSDCNASPYIGYYMSYFELPDKQSDVMDFLGEGCLKYNGASSLGVTAIANPSHKIDENHLYARLPNIPSMGMYSVRSLMPERNYVLIRELFALYEYMKRKGVAGRLSYTFHPRVCGDKEYYYRLRTSHDRKHAVLVIARGCGRKVTVFPDGLLPEQEYTIVFNSSGKRFIASGAALLEDGITIPKSDCSDVIWFNLTDYPFSGNCPAGKAPVAVYKREENNIKTRGVGIYISAEDDEGKFYYSIKRNGAEITRLANGTFFFDYSPEADICAEYTVSTVDLNRNETAAVTARRIGSCAAWWSAVGGYTTEVNTFGGFSYAYSEDGKTFLPMKRLQSPGTAGFDLGGTPNRIGGFEGYFEASGNTRIGRGWHQIGDTVAARVYTADRDQTVRVTGHVMRNYYHNAVDHPVRVSIWRNAEKLWSASIAGGQDVSRSHDLLVNLKKDDQLRFVTDKVKMPRATIYPADLQEDGYPHPTEPADQDAVVIGWAPLITDVNAATYESGMTALSADGRDALYSGAKFKGQKIEPVDGKIELTLDAPSILNDLLFWFDSDDKYMDEGYVTIKVNGRTLCKDFDVVREKDSKGNLLRKAYKSVLAVNGKVKIEITLSGKAKLKYLAMAPANEFRGFYALGQKYIDWSGDVWEKPVIRGGKTVKTDVVVEQALPTLYDAPFYQTACAGQDFEAEVDVPDGIYTVRVLTSNGWTFDGRKPEFDVFINGQPVLEDYNTDKIAEGADIALALRFEGVMPENGRIRVRFKATGKAPAVVTAIAVD